MIGMTNAKTGGELNFAIFGGLTRPANPKTNCIWVETSTDITGWEVGTAYPATPAEGNVFIIADPVTSMANVDISGKLDKIRNHCIKITPSYAYQYISGAWVTKTMKIYNNGAWIDTLTTLYDHGTYADGFTRGWYGSGTESSDRVTVGSDTSGSNNYTSNGTVSLAGIKYVEIDYQASAPGGGAFNEVIIVPVGSEIGVKSTGVGTSAGVVTWRPDVSDVNQTVRFRIASTTSGGIGTISLFKIKLIPGT